MYAIRSYYEQTAASMERIRTVMAKYNATLWIGHDATQTATPKRAPAYYE